MTNHSSATVKAKISSRDRTRKSGNNSVDTGEASKSFLREATNSSR